MQTHIDKVAPIFCQHMLDAQAKQSRANNQLAQPWEFQPGNCVLLLLPTVKFLAHWQGPYTVMKHMGPVREKPPNYTT